MREGFHELVERYRPADRLERAAAADPAGARARGRRAGGPLERRRGAPRRLARASSATRALCPVCGDKCKRRSLPAERPIVFVGDGWSDRCAALACDRVFARTGLAEYLAERAVPVRAVRDAGRRCCCAFLSRTTSSSRRSGSGSSAPTSRTSGTTARCIRAVGGREVRIAAAPGGVDVEPGDAETAAGRREAARAASSTSTRSTPGRRTIRFSGRSRVRFAGLRPPLAPDPFESLVTSITAQQVSLRSAFAMRSRMIERFGERAGRAWAFPTRERIARADGGRAVRGRLLAPQGRVRARPGAERPRPRRARRARRRRDPRAPHGGPRARRLDGGVVPRAPPRAAARVAGRRPRAPQGGHAALRCRCARARPAPRPVPEPLGPLPAGGGAPGSRRMTIRRATEADEAVLRELWSEFEAEVPYPVRRGARDLGRGVARHARRHSRRRRVPRRGRRRARRRGPHRGRPSKGRAHIQIVHVRPRGAPAGRRDGAAARVRRRTPATAARRGSASTCWPTTRPRARSGGGFGFEELELLLVAPIDALERAARARSRSASRARRPTSRPTTSCRSSGRSRISCRGSRRPT